MPLARYSCNGRIAEQSINRIIMKRLFIYLTVGLTLSLGSTLFQSCNEKDDALSLEQDNFYSIVEIEEIKDWLTSQRDLDNGKLELNRFPKLQFKPDLSSTDNQIIEEYFNGLLFLNDAIINGKELNYSYNFLIKKINEDGQIDEAGKNLLLSSIQLSREVFTSDVAIEFYNRGNTTIELRDACGCNNIYATYVTYSIQCQAYGNYWGHCDWASYYYSQYIACLNQDIHCPAGFTYDGANCYSGVHFPSGYNGFIYGNGFYTQQNCSISTANNCCPGGFGYDGTNCHYWGLYFPSDYEPFIWNNTFYVKPNCY